MMNAREKARKSFLSAWNKAYGNRPATVKATLPVKTHDIDQVMTAEEIKEFASMPEAELRAYNEKMRSYMIGDVFKDTKSFGPCKWKAKTKHGLESFRTKKAAKEFCDKYMATFAEHLN